MGFADSHTLGRVRRALLGVVVTLSLVAMVLTPAEALTQTQATDPSFTAWEVESIDPTAFGVASPQGLAYSTEASALLVFGTAGPSTTPYATFTMLENLAGSSDLPLPITASWNIAFDPAGERLAVLDGDSLMLFDLNGSGGATMLSSASASALGLVAPRGMTFDTAGTLYILDAASSDLVRVDPIAGSNFLAIGTATRTALSAVGTGQLAGIGFSPEDGLLHVVNSSEERAYGVDASGAAQTSIDLTGLGITNPQAVLFAPSTDSTDSSDTHHAFIAVGPSGTPNPRVVEIGLKAEPAAALRGAVISALVENTYVRTIDSSSWTPPSSDTAGITYDPAIQRLLVSDSEINEPNLADVFDGVNLWQSTTLGAATGTGFTETTNPGIDEPTGIAHNPNTGHLYITDDSGNSIYDVDPGADGLHGTSDDTSSRYRLSDTTPPVGDPEGIGYDAVHNEIFVASGTDREIYRIQPGSDSVLLTGDDVITSFDTDILGVDDPEGVVYYPSCGTLLMIDRESETVTETTVTGSLVNTYDYSTGPIIAAAGITLAPASNGSGATHMYIADRGIDNNSQTPPPVDGAIHEVSGLVSCSGPTTDVYLSDLTPTFETNGWGPYEGGDVNNGENQAGDGGPIVVNGITYPKGVGVHAQSELHFDISGLSGSCTLFTDIGIDDAKGNAGNVNFIVRKQDNTQLYSSNDDSPYPGGITGATPTVSVALALPGVTSLRLIADQNQGGINSDWADWADARVACSLPQVSVTAVDGAEELSADGMFTVFRTGPTTNPLSVDVNVTGTATAPPTAGFDYVNAVPNPVVIPAGQASVDVMINPVDDTEIEGDETVALAIVTDPAYTIGSPPSATVTITDNDVPEVSVTAVDGAEEGQVDGVFTVSRTGPTTDALSVVVDLAGSTATAPPTTGFDYVTAVPNPVIIPVGQSSVDVVIDPVDDAEIEGNETVELAILADAAYQVGSAAAATVTIVDNDLPEVSVLAVDGAEEGPVDGVFTVSRTGPTTDALSVVVNVTGTATVGDDYSTAVPNPVIIPATQASVDVVIDTIDDADVDPGETVELTIVADAAYEVGSPGAATVTIVDNDSAPPAVPVSGVVSGVDHLWKTVSLPVSFVDPVVVAGPASINGGDPGVVEVRNVTATSFEVRFREWDYLDGVHGLVEDVSYLVVERGVTVLASGARIEAGTVTGVGSTTSPVSFGGSFGAVPVVVSTVVSEPGVVMAPRLQAVTTSGFSVLAQDQESGVTPVPVGVNWVAWEQGSNAGSDGFAWETASVITGDGFAPVTFTGSYAKTCVLADLSTFNGPDPAGVRYQNRTTTGIEVQVDEEQSLDGETFHTTETINLLVIDCVPPPASVPVSGVVSGVDHLWKTVSLSSSFVDPVVVAGPASINGGDPGVVEVRNVTATSFEVRFREWDYLDGVHGLVEDVSYLVVERGVTVLASGARIEAGTVTGVGSTTSPVSFGGSFGAVPVVVSTVVSEPGVVMAPRLQAVTTSGFSVLAQDQESGVTPVPVGVNWVAWEQGSNAGSDGFAWETKSVITGNEFAPVTFTGSYAKTCVLADLSTFNGPDTATVRYQNRTTTGIQVQVDEEQSLDGETFHTTETINLLIIDCN